MTDLNNLLPISKSTAIAGGSNGDLPEIDWGAILRGIGTFFSGFGASYGANTLTENDKKANLYSALSQSGQIKIDSAYEYQKALFNKVIEIDKTPRNNPAKRVEADQSIKQLRVALSENYKYMASIIHYELPSMRVNDSKVVPLAESVLRGLNEEAVQVLNTNHQIRMLRPQDSHSRANYSNMQIANSIQISSKSNLSEKIVDPVIENAVEIKQLFNLDVVNNLKDRDVANYLMALSNGQDADKVFEISSNFQKLSGTSAEDYKNAITGQAISIMDAGNEKTRGTENTASYQL